MKFDRDKSLEILERTPYVIKTLLKGLSDEWILNNEGGETWSPYDVIGHLIHGDTTNWMQRTNIILSESTDKQFKPFDRFAQFEESKGKTLDELLDRFTYLRSKNIEFLKSLKIDEATLDKTGIHPRFGEVTLR